MEDTICFDVVVEGDDAIPLILKSSGCSLDSLKEDSLIESSFPELLSIMSIQVGHSSTGGSQEQLLFNSCGRVSGTVSWSIVSTYQK